jgi:truncated hemoglobin YjbI
MNHYLVIKTEVDKEENISTEVVLKYKKLEAEVEFFSMIDNFYSRLIQDNKIMHFEEFNVADFGDEERGHFVFEFKDYEGEINLKIELKRL